jgi:DnaK suppressor protein
MKTALIQACGFRETLEQKEAELVRVLWGRDRIAIEKSADELDAIQCASERDMAIRNVDRESTLLREVKSALRRVHDGTYGICTECESVIGSKRLTAMPWAPFCIRCQEAADRDRAEDWQAASGTLVSAA